MSGYTNSDGINCDVCGLPVGEDAHWGHEPECARHQDSDNDCDMGCELYYHPECCPECNEAQ